MVAKEETEQIEAKKEIANKESKKTENDKMNDKVVSKEEVSNEELIGALRQVVDPELQIDIWTLELIRKLEVKDGVVNITMTFTTPLCPYGPIIVEDMKEKLRQVKGVKAVDVLVSFEPLWEPSDELKEMLGIGL